MKKYNLPGAWHEDSFRGGCQKWEKRWLGRIIPWAGAGRRNPTTYKIVAPQLVTACHCVSTPPPAPRNQRPKKGPIDILWFDLVLANAPLVSGPRDLHPQGWDDQKGPPWTLIGAQKGGRVEIRKNAGTPRSHIIVPTKPPSRALSSTKFLISQVGRINRLATELNLVLRSYSWFYSQGLVPAELGEL